MFILTVELQYYGHTRWWPLGVFSTKELAEAALQEVRTSKRSEVVDWEIETITLDVSLITEF